jgi:hypothetical protein
MGAAVAQRLVRENKLKDPGFAPQLGKHIRSFICRLILDLSFRIFRRNISNF